MSGLNWKLLFAILALAPIAACTHSKAVSERVDEQVEAEPEVPPGTPASVASRKVIAESLEITAAQKMDLLSIHEKMARDVADIRSEMAKLQVILFRKVLDSDPEEAQIKNIRRRLLNLDRKRTGRILSALDEARNVIGMNALQKDPTIRREPFIDALEPWKMM